MEQRAIITDQGDCTNPKLKPIVPPKPQMDEQKHNGTKMVDGNADIDLDSLLMELCALENQLNSSAAATNPASVLSQFTSSSIPNSQNRSEISDRQDYSPIESSSIARQENMSAFCSSMSSKIIDDATTFNPEISTPSKSESTTPTVATYEKLVYNDNLDRLVKSSKYIKYLCAESEESAKFWTTALRLAKQGKRLFDNFVQCCEYLSEQEDKNLSSSSKIGPTFHNEINSSSTVPSTKSEKFLYDGTTRSPLLASPTPNTVNGKSGRSPSIGRPSKMPPAIPSSFGRSTLRSLDNLSNVSSSGCSLRDSESVTEIDSDEEDIITVSVCDIRCVIAGDAASTSNGESFPPPPPPPPPLCLGGAADDDNAYERPRTAVNNSNDDNVSVNGSVGGDVIDMSTVRRRKVPPAPPKRSENTRLSTTLSMTSSTTSLNINQTHNFYANEQSSAANSGRFSNLSSPSSGDRTPISSDITSSRMLIINNIVQHKPPLPTKPKFLTKTADVANNMDNKEIVSPQPIGFQSELQLAMQKRLQKLNNLTEEQQS
uniref:PH domain-containing protein n=1 Tax=Romanomermis culicivorax TaxID=13658 RepID=A0A915L0X1_ROMCU